MGAEKIEMGETVTEKINKIIDEIRSSLDRSKESVLVITKLEEARMWLGQYEHLECLHQAEKAAQRTP